MAFFENRFPLFGAMVWSFIQPFTRRASLTLELSFSCDSSRLRCFRSHTSRSISISVTAINAPGSLAEIAGVIASNDANIDTLSMVRKAPDFTEMQIDLEVWDLKHLNRVLTQLKANTAVSDARRVNG